MYFKELHLISPSCVCVVVAYCLPTLPGGRLLSAHYNHVMTPRHRWEFLCAMLWVSVAFLRIFKPLQISWSQSAHTFKQHNYLNFRWAKNVTEAVVGWTLNATMVESRRLLTIILTTLLLECTGHVRSQDIASHNQKEFQAIFCA